jgi:hypothetical protein
MALIAVWSWLAGLGLHACAIWRITRRDLAGASADERLFASVVAGIGTLSAVLHVLALSVGLTLTRGLAGLAILDGTVWLWTRRSADPLAPRPHGATATSSSIAIAELAAAVALVAIVLAWIDHASMSALVDGTDAAHYHVPVAVNLALGTRLFDLPATPHAYPMAGSLLDAWFIAPLGTLLFVDLTMVLPFLLLVASLLWIFRLVTGESGLAWATWPVLALFGAPLFRMSSLVSADLWFAAGFAAVAAVVLAVSARRVVGKRDLLLGALALGLLLGSKTSGAAAALLIAFVWILVEAVRWIATRDAIAWPAGLPAAVTMASIAALASGGVWLIRDWVLFGSPIAPQGVQLFGVTIFSGDTLGPTTYLSVFGDLARDPHYDLAGRTRLYVRLWLGRWFPWTPWLLALIPIDLMIAARRRGADAAVVWTRGLLLALTVGAGGALVWLLVGAPWTSLDWTRGFSLRYALPVAAFMWLSAYVALFPAAWRWYTRETTASAAMAIAASIGCLVFASALHGSGARHSDVPPVTWTWCVVALGVVGAARWIASRRSRLTAPVAVGAMLVFASAWTPVVIGRDAAVRQLAIDGERRERAGLAAGTRTGSAARDLYLAVRDAEDAVGRSCGHRRFFAIVRLDEPLMLQSYDLPNRVFYAGRDVASAARSGPMGSCDYLIATQAVMDTEKGQALARTLTAATPLATIASSDTFIVFARRDVTP